MAIHTENGRIYDGCVLALNERNYANDSYFYAEVWDRTTKNIIKVSLGSTAFGGRDHAEVDATPEVIAEYEREIRKAKIRNKRIWRKEFSDLAKELRLPSMFSVMLLKTAFNAREFEEVVKLLKTKKFKNEFRRSITEQIRAWCENKNDTRLSPLTASQKRYIFHWYR